MRAVPHARKATAAKIRQTGRGLYGFAGRVIPRWFSGRDRPGLGDGMRMHLGVLVSYQQRLDLAQQVGRIDGLNQQRLRAARLPVIAEGRVSGKDGGGGIVLLLAGCMNDVKTGRSRSPCACR